MKKKSKANPDEFRMPVADFDRKMRGALQTKLDTGARKRRAERKPVTK